MENIRIAFSDDLKGTELVSRLRGYLINESLNSKNEANYENMLHCDEEMEESIKKFESVCFIYTTFPYKSHFTLIHEQKKEEDKTKNLLFDIYKEISPQHYGKNDTNADIIFKNETNYDKDLFSDSESEQSEEQEMHLSLILLILEEQYVKQQFTKEKNVYKKIEKLKKEYPTVRIICFLIGVREHINTTVVENRNFPIVDINVHNNINNEECIIVLTNSDIDRLITSLLIFHNVDSIELETIDSLHKHIFKFCKYLYESKIRKPNSYFKSKPSGIMSLKNQIHLDDEIENTENTSTTGNKADNIIWASQLMQISGISEDVSRRIAQIFHSPFHLITHLQKTKDEECLKDIVISSSYGERKLGKALSKKIYRIFASNSSEHDFVS